MSARPHFVIEPRDGELSAKRELRVLVVEDSLDDADLLLRELQRSYEVAHERVETAEAMRTALAGRTWDLVISDYSMPHFDGLAALRLLREIDPDMPFLFVSGTMGEETAVKALQSGASDFFVKGRLGRLGPAIERALADVALRERHRQVEAQLLVADRMAAVGTLAAGVAHEINNPLAAVLLSLDLALSDLAAPGSPEGVTALVDRLRMRLTEGREAAMTVRQIVRDLKIFSRGEDEKPGAVDVRRVMESTLRMAWNEVRHRARLVKSYGDVPLVQATEARLGQVLLNVVVNAAQAIPVGDAHRNEIRVTTWEEDGQVVISIADTGSGIAPEMLPRLFTPFATTKPVGEGTGLGLFLCRRIVSGFGGEITVESEVGRGTSVRISLPAAGGAEGPAAVASPRARPAARRGRILVVDDEPMIANGLQLALAAEHDVTVTTRGRDALARIAAGARFDVILCDLMMPDLTGMDVHATLVKLAPGQAAAMVFLTGGAFTAPARAFVGGVDNLCLEKPFEVDHLRSVVNERVR